MKRSELIEMRKDALLALKALFVGTLDHVTMQDILPTQIAAAAELHAACTRELEGPFLRVDDDALVRDLFAIGSGLENTIGEPDVDKIDEAIRLACRRLKILGDLLVAQEETDQAGGEDDT